MGFAVEIVLYVLNLLLLDAFDFGLGWYSPRVMRFVVDHDQATSRGNLPENFSDISLVALGPALIDRLLSGELLFGFPVKAVPVADEHSSLAEFVQQGRRDNVGGILRGRECFLDRNGYYGIDSVTEAAPFS